MYARQWLKNSVFSPQRASLCPAWTWQLTDITSPRTRRNPCGRSPTATGSIWGHGLRNRVPDQTPGASTSSRETLWVHCRSALPWLHWTKNFAGRTPDGWKSIISHTKPHFLCSSVSHSLREFLSPLRLERTVTSVCLNINSWGHFMLSTTFLFLYSTRVASWNPQFTIKTSCFSPSPFSQLSSDLLPVASRRFSQQVCVERDETLKLSI